MKKIFDRFPFYLPFLGVCLGFLLSEFNFLAVPFLLTWILWFLWIYINGRFYYFQYFIYTGILFVILGFFRCEQNKLAFQRDLKCVSKASHLGLVVTQNLGKRKNWYRFECKVHKSSVDGLSWNLCHDANIDLYVKDTTMIDEGSHFFLSNVHFVPFQKASLPGEFNLQKLKFSRKFVGLFFAKSANISHVTIYENGIYAWRNKVKSFLNVSFVEGLSPSNLMLVRQLMWGDKTQIDDDLKSAFQISGTTHVLSVSGMHMALLFALIHFILDRFSRKKTTKRLLKLFIIPILWVYAFFTGFSAPVLRAVSFFTYYLIGNVLFQRSLKLLHVLLVVGLIQLLVDPFSLYDIGFQLSYSAVLGLSVILPVLKSYYENSPFYWQWILDALAISLSSSITTYPLILYYFHQFSVWFLIGNLLLLPLFTVLMYALFFLVFLAMIYVKIPFVVSGLNVYINLISSIVKLSISLPFPYVFTYGFDEFMLAFHFGFVYFLIVNFYRGWRFISYLFCGFILLNFTLSMYRRNIRNREDLNVHLKISGGHLHIQKSQSTLKIMAEPNVPQEKIEQKIAYLLKSMDVDTVIYTYGIKGK